MKNNKLKLKTQHRFKSEMHNVSTEETNEIPLSWNDNWKTWSVDLGTCIQDEQGSS